jgi:hypothetical protein
VVLAASDNWGGDAALAAQATTVGAMPLASGSKDAACAFTPPATGGYTVQVSGVGGTTGVALLEIFEADATRAASVPAAIISHPAATSVTAGGAAAFGLVTVGKPAPTYQWRKDGTNVAGATNSTLALGTVLTTDAGSYDVVVANGTGTATSTAAVLTVTAPTSNSATHAAIGGGYIAGSMLTITNTLTFAGAPTSLGWTATLPAGWTYVSDGGAAGEVKPAAGASGTVAWSWTSIPANPVTFTYTVNVPAGETADRTITASATVNAGGSTTVTATPNPLTIPVQTYHSADTDKNFRLSLLELTRVIELYNTRNGTTRTGCYAVATTTTEDGYNPEPTRLGSTVVTLARYHSADSNHDGKLSLLELTRVIELYNTRSGTTRTGAYHRQLTPPTEDGFAPGP